MIDPSVDLSKVLKGVEKVFWAQRVEEDVFWASEQNAKKHALPWLTGTLLIGPYLLFKTYTDLRADAFRDGVDLFDPIIVTRRDDDDSENSFYMDLASHLPVARTIIQTLLQES